MNNQPPPRNPYDDVNPSSSTSSNQEPFHPTPPLEQGGDAAVYSSGPGSMQPPRATGSNGMAVAGMVMGILSLTLGCLICPPLFSIPGLIFSYIGRKQIRQTGEEGMGMATAGLVTSWISVGLTILGIIIYAIFIGIAIASGEEFK